MSSPKLPKQTTPPAQPSLVDPTVLFARAREKQKALGAMGRNSTILSSASGLGGPVPKPNPASVGSPATGY